MDPLTRIIPRNLTWCLVFCPWGAYAFLFLPLGFSNLQRLGWGAWFLFASYALFQIPGPIGGFAVRIAAGLLLLSAVAVFLVQFAKHLNFKKALLRHVGRSKLDQAQEYFAGIAEAGETPAFTCHDVDLYDGEFVIYREDCRYYELKPIGLSRSVTRSHRGFFSGWISQSISKRDTRETFQESAQGTAFVTNMRVIFIGDKRSFERHHPDVLKAIPSGQDIHIHFHGKPKPIALKLKNPYIWEGWHRFLKHANLKNKKIPQKFLEIE